MDAFDRFAAAALPVLGVPLGEGDLDVLRMVQAAFAPALSALDAIDLQDFAPERGLDPSHAP
jgi:hypothetical protein